MLNIATMLYAAILGCTGMAVWLMLMYMFGFISFGLLNYQGCMVTGKTFGLSTFLAGMGVHYAIGIAYTFLFYSWAIPYFNIAVLWHEVLLFGVIQWLFAGIIIAPLLDKMSGCVANKTVAPMRIFASGYGIPAVSSFFIGMLIFSFIVCAVLT